MNKFVLAIPFLLAALGACNPQTDGAVSAEPPLAGARIGGPFRLENQDGARVTEASFPGRYRLVYFGYSYCPDVCPVDLQHLLAGYRQFERSDPARAAKIQPIFVTVDPGRDTPAKLKQFVGQFHPRLIGLTGSADDIAAVAKAYAVQYHKVEGSTPDAYLMAHSQLAYLMAPDGKPLALIPTDDISTKANEGDPALVAAELGKWVR